MTTYAGTAHVNNMRGAAAPRRRAASVRGAKRTSRNLFIMFVSLVLAVFVLVGLSAYAASLQHANNVLEEQNKSLQAEIFSLNSQIVDETKVTKVEQVATEKYGMVYPTSENCIVIGKDDTESENLAATIRGEAYN